MATEHPQSASESRKRHWSLIRLGSLLIVLLVVGAVCYWYFDHRRVTKAREDYAALEVRYQVGLVPSILDLCEASRALAEAEEASPFIGTVRARAGHLLRVSEMELKWRAFIQVALFASEAGHEQALKELDEVVRYCIEAQEWLREALGK